ncbi:MAG: hypothetical protein Q9195_003373 [Heterodermia aff. obscurata]
MDYQAPGGRGCFNSAEVLVHPPADPTVEEVKNVISAARLAISLVTAPKAAEVTEATVQTKAVTAVATAAVGAEVKRVTRVEVWLGWPFILLLCGVADDSRRLRSHE